MSDSKGCSECQDKAMNAPHSAPVIRCPYCAALPRHIARIDTWKASAPHAPQGPPRDFDVDLREMWCALCSNTFWTREE